MNSPIFRLNNKLIYYLEKRDQLPLGLTDGKMGICIYFYSLNSIYNNKNYKTIADKFLDEVFENIDMIKTIDVKNGLAGIGLGIDYLIKNNYVKGNVNAILSDVDDIIFKNLSYSKYYERIDSSSLVHILYYLCIRFENQKQGSETKYLYKELIIDTINNLYDNLSPNFHEEPLSYNTEYILPQLLFVLSRIYRLDFYNYRLIKIIEELSYKVLSTFPILHSNRLYLLWGMDCLKKYIQDEYWSKHICLLKDNMDLNHILKQEIRNRNIYFNDGITSLYFLVNNLSDYFNNNELKIFNQRVINKINISQVWELLENNSQYFNLHSGLYSGFTGVSLLLHKLQYIK